MMKRLVGLLAMAAALATGFAAPNNFTVFVGTYTGPKSQGIYKFTFDARTGTAGPVELAAQTESPSFLAIHPNGRFLYAVNETDNFQRKKQGAVSAFNIAPKTHALTFLNQQPSLGAHPCHLTIDPKGHNALVANYTGGNLAVIPIGGDGGLKEPSQMVQHQGTGATPRQKEPHAHSIHLDRSGKLAFAADLGLDKIMIYDFDETLGKLTPHNPPYAALKGGSGPRHFAWHPAGKRAYVINELSSTLTAFDYDARKGTLTETQSISTLPQATPGNSTAEVVVHPSGKWVYGSNRGHDSIAVFSIARNGELKRVQNENIRGKTPRNFAIDPTGKYLLAEGQNSGTIAIFDIDQKSGALSHKSTFEAPTPVCLRFLPN
jgi:6-phosphogluconolactonase